MYPMHAVFYKEESSTAFYTLTELFLVLPEAYIPTFQVWAKQIKKEKILFGCCLEVDKKTLFSKKQCLGQQPEIRVSSTKRRDSLWGFAFITIDSGEESLLNQIKMTKNLKS